MISKTIYTFETVIEGKSISIPINRNEAKLIECIKQGLTMDQKVNRTRIKRSTIYNMEPVLRKKFGVQTNEDLAALFANTDLKPLLN